jgi:hypothetical protein
MSMGIAGTCVIYLVVGGVVAAAMTLRETPSPSRLHHGAPLAWALFWPLFAPALLARPERPLAEDKTKYGARLREAEHHLAKALSELPAGSGGALAPEVDRVRGLTASLESMARRCSEMEASLSSPALDPSVVQKELDDLVARGSLSDDPRIESLRSRLRNIERLHGLHASAAGSLERAILKVEEMSTQVLLLRFAESSEADVVEMIKEIAENVEEISESLMSAVC